MKKIKHSILSLIVILSFLVAPLFVSSAHAAPVTSFAATCKSYPLLTFPAWYKGLSCKDGAVDVSKSENGADLGLNGVWIIVLNVLDALIQVSALVSLGFIIWGGFKFIKSQGDPAKINEGRDAIIKAIIGLVISIGSVALIQLVAGRIN